MATNSNQYYIYAVQDGVIRLTNRSPNQIVGATTNGVQTCVVHVFIGVNGNVSFFHTATTVSLASIQKELEWAKPLRKWYIVANDNQKYDKNRPELQKLQEVKAYVSEHDPISPEEKCLANQEAIAVTYRRYNQQEPLIIGDSPDNDPIIMPPFADKLLAISFLNGLVSGLDTVDLLVQYDVDRWTIEDKMTPNAKQVFSSNSHINETLKQLVLPPTITLDRLEGKKKLVEQEVERLKQSSNVSWVDIVKGYIWDDPALQRLRDITDGFPFIGIKSARSTITAWLVVDDNGKPAQRCQQIIKDALKKRNLSCAFDEIENPRNAMSTNVTTITIPDMQKKETAEKLRRS